jgi:hypothetical protein
MLRTAYRVCLMVVCLVVCNCKAEKIDMSPDALRNTATDVIVGKVLAIYERVENTPQWRYTRYIAETQILTVEKGESLKTGDLVYARYWRAAWQGSGPVPPSTSGHRGLPVVNDSMRIYLARNAYDGFGDTHDGGYTVIGANGFEKLRQ